MRTSLRLLVSGLFVAVLIVFAPRPAKATTFSGNGNTGFGGNLGGGVLNVTNDGTGGLNFVFTLDGTSGIGTANAIVIYIDNSTGGGIGASTALLDDTSNGASEAVSEYGGVGDQSILNFGGLMSPQYGISLTNNNALDYKLVNGGVLTFTDNADVSGTSAAGEKYTISGDTWSLDLPAVDFGLSSFSGDTVKFVAIAVSQTGYSSNEATAAITGNLGYSGTQTLSSVDTFTVANVPEASTAGLVMCAAGVLLVVHKRRWFAS